MIFDSFAVGQPLAGTERQEITVSPEGKVITHSPPRIYAVQNSQITVKIIKFQD